MLIRILLASAVLLPVPALAESLHDTHRQVSMPAGKTVAVYRPIERSDCATTASHHQSGKMQLSAATPAACAEYASRTPRSTPSAPVEMVGDD